MGLGGRKSRFLGLEEVLGSGSGRRSGEVWEVGLGGRM